MGIIDNIKLQIQALKGGHPHFGDGPRGPNAKQIEKLRKRSVRLNKHPKLRAFYDKYMTIAPINSAILAIVLEIVIEAFGHKNPVGGFWFLATHPLVFLANALIIYATLSLAWLSKRRTFYNAILSTIWLLLGAANGIILIFRMTPFTTADLNYVGMALDILPNYMNTFEMSMLAIVLIAILLSFVALFFLAPTLRHINYKKSVAMTLVCILLCSGGYLGAVKSGVLSSKFGNLWDAYSENGVPYCFLTTWLNRGVSKPKGYDKTMIEGILPKAELNTQYESEEKPNIIFLQLESFIDADEIKSLELSGPAIPYYDELMENYSSGYLDVSVFGGGTANTEFEVMSGLYLGFFGPGEFPYKSVLAKETVETMAYDLKDLGYATHAMHNHRGAFYNRNTVFANMGFDDFTSLEYMSYVDKTPRNWARDEILTGELIDAMRSTKSKDYTYCISVQGHGEYPTKSVLQNPRIKVSAAEGSDITEERLKQYEYYIQQTMEMDDFVRDLTAELQKFEEPVVLVMYGDHLPALGETNEDMASGSIYKTQYVIWDNYGLAPVHEDVPTYRLSSVVQQRIGMMEGTTTTFHRNSSEDPNYMDELHALQYDMLYGKRYAYYDGEKDPFKPTDIQMGYKPIRILDMINVGGNYYITGEGFTPFSKISLDGKILNTVFLSSTTLKLEDAVDKAELKNLKVSQVEKNNTILSTTE
ncbi:MAG: LTA synthase family protein [Clostridiales Family XIII bacterium]|jgi:hypothetical protein|nr:LTA synthase family protein [Clostridiales Family XIII bacterium]